jgi:Fe-S-cluster containining protein
MTVADPAVFCSFFPGLKELGELYRDMDREIERFKKAAALDCPEFCKKCCAATEERIEVSVFECLPLSIHLWGRGEAESILARIAAGDEKSLCVLRNPADSFAPAWGCALYAWRPLLCRLFGFSAVLDKRGHPRIALCRAIKDADPGAESRAAQKIASGLKPVVLPHWAERISSLNPHLGRKRYPINQALRLALEKVGLRACLLREEGGRERQADKFKENTAEKRFYRGQR